MGLLYLYMTLVVFIVVSDFFLESAIMFIILNYLSASKFLLISSRIREFQILVTCGLQIVRLFNY
jgi:hypothetical protein